MGGVWGASPSPDSRRNRGSIWEPVHINMCFWGDEGWCRRARWCLGSSPAVWWGRLRAVLRGWGCGTCLEGLPVDGTCSVFFIFSLRHPHLFKGVQRCQDGAAAKGERLQSAGFWPTNTNKECEDLQAYDGAHSYSLQSKPTKSFISNMVKDGGSCLIKTETLKRIRVVTVSSPHFFKTFL